MHYLRILAVIILIAAAVVSCKQKKEMSLNDYGKIEAEINLPDPELDKKKTEEVTKKYGFTYEQYKEMFDKVQKDPALKEKLGEIRLQDQKAGDK